MIIDELFEAPQQCPECGGISFSNLILAEKKDACYHKVKASAKVWPSAYASGRLVQCRKKGAANYGNKSESVAEASDQSNAISQEQLNQMYANAKPMMFIKNTPVALVPLAKINQIGTPQQVQQVQQALGSVDQTSYTDEYKNKGYVVFQWNGTALDLYVASPEVVSQKYVKFSGQLPQDEKSRGKIPSLVALSKLGIDPSKVPFFVKKVPNEMVSAKQLGLEGKTIQVFWGSDPSTQEVAPGGFLTKNEHGMIYTIAPDAQGLPIGYLPAQQGVAEGQLELNTPDPVVVVQDLKGKILDKINLSVAAQKYKLGPPQNIKTQLAHQNYTTIGNYVIVSPMSGQPQDQTTIGQKSTFATTEGEQQKPEEKYGPEYNDMVARVKKLAGLGPMKTVYDPAKRVYRNVPTAQQPKK